jgi:hypothetical protein
MTFFREDAALAASRIGAGDLRLAHVERGAAVAVVSWAAGRRGRHAGTRPIHRDHLAVEAREDLDVV